MKGTSRKLRAVEAPRRIPFCVPSTDQTEIDQVSEAIRSGWLTTGPKVKEFEQRIARYVGAQHAVAVNSCTAALHIALAAAGVKRGDEVITTPYTFAATGETILYQGARPVFADIEPRTLNIDPAAIRRAITRRTRAIVPVHMAGLACEMDEILEIGKRRGIPVIEDAAHALGSTVGKRPIGALSDMTCFSFYATKNLTTGEGGMLTTNDADLAARVRRLSLHGLSRDAWKRYTASGTWKYDIVDLGYKYNMTDVAAGIGLAQLAKFRGMQARRRTLALRYSRLLAASDVFDLPAQKKGWTHAWHLYMVRLRPGTLKIGRDQVIEELKDRGIGTSVHFIPLHLHSFYRRKLRHPKGSFPHAEREWARAISLPLFPGLSLDDQDRVVESLLDIAARHRR
ncbi:MAG: DegT/DnrJ/EryC1/StrS family aminotransferase [Candidatus Polarisedimenticolia bacterium]